MKLYVNGQLIDPEETPVILVWLDDKDRMHTLKNIAAMDEKHGVRAYGVFPDTMTATQSWDMMKKACAKFGVVGQLAAEDIKEQVGREKKGKKNVAR